MIRAALSSLFISLAAFAAAPLQGAPFERHTDDLARETRSAGQEGKLLAVLFELEDCPNCRELRADVLSKARATAFERHFRTVSVTIDARKNPLTLPDGASLPRGEWALKLGIYATPALGFFDGKGQLVYRHLGTLSSAEELVLLGRYIAEEAFDEAPWFIWRDLQLGKTAASGHGHGAVAHDEP
jgi:thioredoxin-related protein